MKLAIGSLVLAVLGWLGIYQPQPQKPAPQPMASDVPACVLTGTCPP